MRNTNLQHWFKLACYDPKGCIAGTRLQDDNDQPINATWNPSDPCNSFKNQYYQMQPNTTQLIALCYTSDSDNGVAVLVHQGGNIKVFSSADYDNKLTNEEDWPDTIGYQKMVEMTVISTQNSITSDHLDDWLVDLQEELVFPMDGTFFRCNGPSCGCTVVNNTWTDCESFIFHLGDISYEYNVTRTYTYLTILAQIGGLCLLGYAVIKIISTVIFLIEEKKKNPQHSYAELLAE